MCNVRFSLPILPGVIAIIGGGCIGLKYGIDSNPFEKNLIELYNNNELSKNVMNDIKKIQEHTKSLIETV